MYEGTKSSEFAQSFRRKESWGRLLSDISQIGYKSGKRRTSLIAFSRSASKFKIVMLMDGMEIRKEVECHHETIEDASRTNKRFTVWRLEGDFDILRLLASLNL